MQEILRKASVAFVLKVAGAGFAFAFHVAIARLLGATGSGLYFLAFTIMTLTAVVSRLGMDHSVTRFVAAHASESDWAGVKGVVQHALRLVLAASFVLALALFLAADWLAHTVFDEPALGLPLRNMAIAIVPLAWMTVYASALQGLRNVRDSLLMQSVLLPLVAAALLFLFVPLFDVSGAVFAYSLGITLALGYGFWMWRRALSAHHAAVAAFPVRALFGSSFPLLGAMLLEQLMLAVPVLFLGIWEESSEVGLFSAAQRAAALVGLVLIAANSIVAPKFATLHRQGDMVALGRVVRHSALLMTLMASPALLLLLLAPQWVMTLFGPEFSAGWLMLVIMALGQLVNVMTGSVGFLLMMTGHERSFLSANALAVLICAGFAALLIPNFGGLGAAIAAAVSLAVVNLLRVRYVWLNLHIMVLPIPRKMK
jgi:O-antigen/teichoic acid export membrane protein